MPLNTKLVNYIKPELSENGSKLATYIHKKYGEDYLTREDLILLAEELIMYANYTTRKGYQEFTGKGKDAHYWRNQYKFLQEFNLVEI